MSHMTEQDRIADLLESLIPPAAPVDFGDVARRVLGEVDHMRQITEHTILAMPDAMKEIDARGNEIVRLRAALEHITRECSALNKGPVAVNIARSALTEVE